MPFVPCLPTGIAVRHAERTDITKETSMKTVLLVGATGNLGGLIGRELLKRGARLRLLVRPGSRSKVPADLAPAAEIVEEGQTAFQGVFSVVSAVQGGPETIVDAQLRFLRAARHAGARRFIASDYSMNLFTVPGGANVSSDHRREFGRRADDERGDVEVVHVLNGAFLDRRVLFGFLGAVNLQKREAYGWGDGHAEMQFTTYDDTAALHGGSGAGRPARTRHAVRRRRLAVV